MEIEMLFSTFMLEISKARTEKEVYTALLKTIKNVIKYNRAFVIKDSNVILSDPLEARIDLSSYADYLEWLKERLLPAFVPEDENKVIGFIPLVKQDKLLGIAVVETNQEPTFEVSNTLQTFAFLTGITVENLVLLEQVQDSEKYIKEILNSLSDGVFVVDKGVIEFKNKKALELLEKYNGLDEIIIEIAQIGEKTGILTKEIGNEYFAIIKNTIDYLGSEKQIINVSNVTSQMELEKLKQLDRMKTEFVANVSHELRTPLAAIKAYTETLLNMEVDPESNKEFLGTIMEQSEKLEMLLNDLLDFTLVESGTMELEFSEFEICKLVDSVVKKLIKLSEKLGVKVLVNCDSFEVKADKKRIFQVIYNLLDNAIKFSDKQKDERIAKIAVKKSEDDLVIIVEDNGIGISPEDKEKIFEKFYRGDRSLTYEASGTGLGLTIAREIIRLHGGTIEVESQKGEGSKFIVRIPQRA
ncbi:GHKL domain-containing protein [Thermosipho ferrireducens]|uniref:histidine kinase n=1 Tax=Thermosipho ferrireducens TaxID=2571116 RepID=A0ABX7S9F5_9BACT|nr:GHKL domain-containing protein [Thermosipho ferrireducens]